MEQTSNIQHTAQFSLFVSSQRFIFFIHFHCVLIWKRWHFSWKEDYVELVLRKRTYKWQTLKIGFFTCHIATFQWTMRIIIIIIIRHTMQQKYWKINLVGCFKKSYILCSLTRPSPESLVIIISTIRNSCWTYESWMNISHHYQCKRLNIM